MTAGGSPTGPARPTDAPRLAPHMRLSFDKARARWIVQGPERLFVPDEIAADILRRCDGSASIASIVDALAGEYDATREDIASDVLSLIDELRSRGVLVA